MYCNFSRILYAIISSAQLTSQDSLKSLLIWTQSLARDLDVVSLIHLFDVFENAEMNKHWK